VVPKANEFLMLEKSPKTNASFKVFLKKMERKKRKSNLKISLIADFDAYFSKN